MSAIFYHNERQKKLAVETREREALKSGGRIHTEIVPASIFYRAEGYHQKYYLRMKRELVRMLETMHSSEDEFVNSALAARLNGYFAGYATSADIEAELGRLGLSVEQRNMITGSLSR